MIKRIYAVILLVLISVMFLSAIGELDVLRKETSKVYYLENALSETGARNAVTAIYLDYRLFDSIFEASILLVAVTGIIFMSREDIEHL